MRKDLIERYPGTLPEAPRRYLGAAIAALFVVGLVTVGARDAGGRTPYDLINESAARSPITVHRLRAGVAMLEGSGGNIGVLVGPAGKLMVDTGIAVSEDKIKAALGGLGSAPLRKVILTHWHWDHSDGDAWVRRAGVTLIADPNAIARLKRTTRIVEWGHTFQPAAAADLPNEPVLHDRTMRFGAETVTIRHYRPGHTDGDLSVYLHRADVLQTGDTCWNGVYPFIDYVGGGGIDGAIGAANENLRLAGRRTIVIPGHGPVGDRASLVAFRDMLVEVRGRIAALKAQGKSLAEVQAARPTAALDAHWGQGVIDGRLFTALVFRGV
jgi:glyoxylase-like metal-dependent hydrolase (beta-lactamase superfamily II)